MVAGGEAVFLCCAFAAILAPQTGLGKKQRQWAWARRNGTLEMALGGLGANGAVQAGSDRERESAWRWSRFDSTEVATQPAGVAA
jgi:hypothetical protein